MNVIVGRGPEEPAALMRPVVATNYPTCANAYFRIELFSDPITASTGRERLDVLDDVDSHHLHGKDERHPIHRSFVRNTSP